ncbi:MFS transporter [Streptomyces sp. NPDC059819]|uniref:MFS transporter n=1 Tax=Streptomyces sp. NPDC059819 TaxID=3346963 RepID=UPI0036634DA5
MLETTQSDPARWKALIFICIAQLMVVLDASVVNIALPSAQRDLGFSDADRQWVVTAYTLAFGGLLLFGGRVADTWGRKRAFLTGLVGFAAASAIAGAAVNTGMLLGARALQGVFGALLAPAALSLLTVTFTQGKERAKAFGIFGAISGAGAAVGLILGGVLTEYLSWRWTMYVNIAFAIVAVFGAVKSVHEHQGERNRNRLDVPGVMLASTGLVALVYGFNRAESNGWSSAQTLSLLGASLVLLTAFVVVESKVPAPLLPLRVVADRNRGGAYLSLGLAVIGMFGMFLFLTFYLQIVQGFSALKTGFAFLPMVVGMMIGATQVGARLATRVPPRALMGPGLLIAATGMALLTRISPTSGYAAVVMPGLLLGLGLGMTFMPAMNLATRGVQPADAGVASAMVQTSQQVGGSIGTALLNTIAASATTTWVAAHAAGAAKAGPAAFRNQAAVHGYTTAFWWSSGILVLAATVAVTLINTGAHADPAPQGDSATYGTPAPVALH